MLKSNTNKRGGKREGAGRPVSSNRVKSSITLDKDLKAWVETQDGSLSMVIERALIALKSVS